MPTPVDLALDEVPMARQGFNSSGAPTTVNEIVFTTKRVRQPWPNHLGPLTPNTVALTDFVYATDVIDNVTNNSILTSPQPIANWSIVDRRVVGNSLYLEIVAFHRNGVACVEFSASDGVNPPVTALTATPIVSAIPGDRFAVIVYAVTLDIASLNDNSNITCNAKVYPRVGGASSVRDSAASSVAREFSPRVWRKNTTRFANPPLVYIASGGNDTTGYVGTDSGLAAASPCLTLTGAINRARTVLGTGAGSLDGLRVRFTAGTWSLSASPTANTVNAAVVLEPAPGVAKTDVIWEVGASNISVACTYAHYLGITIRRVGASTLFATTNGHFTLDNCILNMNGNTGALSSTGSCGVFVVGGCEFQNWASGSALNAGTLEVRMIRGLVAGTHAANIATEMFLCLGCNLTGMYQVNGARTYSGAIVAFNRLGRVGAGNAILASGGTVDAVITGAAFIQNLVEWTSATASSQLFISGDGNTANTNHILVWHNTFVGFWNHGRANIFYDETPGDPRTHTLMSMVGNIHVSINTKHDVFAGANLALADASSRTGGWSYMYGVGCRNEFIRYNSAAGTGLGDSFSQAYAGPGSVFGTSKTGAGIDPLFTTYLGTTQAEAAGTGGGTYTLQVGSPARNFVPNSPVPFDLTGAARSGTVAAGAYV